VAAWIARLRSGHLQRALDVAAGRGRHALAAAQAGYLTFAVDRSLEALAEARARARDAGVPLLAWCADLERFPLPPARFDLVVVARYLQRSLWPAIREAVAPGGTVIYETFTIDQRALGTGPRSPDHLLQPGELRDRFDGFEILSYEETKRPEALARLAARRP